MPTEESIARIKLNKMVLSTIMEDMVQSILQYFYIEKLAGSVGAFGTALIVVNAMFMLLKSILFLKTVGMFTFSSIHPPTVGAIPQKMRKKG